MSTANYSHVAPHSDETEQLVLAAMLIERDAVRQAMGLLKGNHEIFYQPKHQALFLAIIRLEAQSMAVDFQSVLWQLEKDGKLHVIGKKEDNKQQRLLALIEFSNAASSTAHLATHCQEMIEHYTRRKSYELARRLMNHAYDPMQDPVDLLAQCQTMLNELTDSLQARRAVQVGTLVPQVIDDLGRAVQRGDSLTGVPSGLKALDRVTGGFQDEDLIIIAARPGMGKTSFALKVARYAAGQGMPGAFFTLEMGNLALVRKMVGTESERTTSQIVRGDLDGGLDEVEYIAQRAESLYSLPLYLDDSPGISINEMRTKAAKMKAELGIRFIICDYLQLMQGDKTKGKGNREQEIASIARGLKLIAKELKLPVIALAQLSRSVETRGGEKKPMLSDLRESGAIEQDADIIIFPYRPEYYKINEDEMGNPTKDLTELIIAKHRNGSLESPVVKSIMKTGTYSDLDDSPAPVGERPFRSEGEVVQLGRLPASTFEEEMPF
ncbi:replicative DNA helicase [Hymenobacter sediminis]|uniref:replicative DNA helicase n=1 Tax=Hymenobacter sediminis TaxID=2218621 RepID=UPI000DA6B5AB|nr:replicative DNA helicase [Hymenobacter sediminis]RPD45482.1 replicative DNA helicase [Hymenobacter sediminis]